MEAKRPSFTDVLVFVGFAVLHIYATVVFYLIPDVDGLATALAAVAAVFFTALAVFVVCLRLGRRYRNAREVA